MARQGKSFPPAATSKRFSGVADAPTWTRGDKGGRNGDAACPPVAAEPRPGDDASVGVMADGDDDEDDDEKKPRPPVPKSDAARDAVGVVALAVRPGDDDDDDDNSEDPGVIPKSEAVDDTLTFTPTSCACARSSWRRAHHSNNRVSDASVGVPKLRESRR